MSRTVGSRALVLSLTVALLGALVPLVHPHAGDAPALYDEHCPLSQIAACGSQAGMAPTVDLVQPPPAADLVLLPTPRDRRWASTPPFAPRGPPIPA